MLVVPVPIIRIIEVIQPFRYGVYLPVETDPIAQPEIVSRIIDGVQTTRQGLISADLLDEILVFGGIVEGLEVDASGKINIPFRIQRIGNTIAGKVISCRIPGTCILLQQGIDCEQTVCLNMFEIGPVAIIQIQVRAPAARIVIQVKS